MGDQSSYSRLREELEDIVIQVRSKDMPLEKCLDLFDEALRIGGQCVESVDRTDFSLAELGIEASPDEDASSAAAPDGQS